MSSNPSPVLSALMQDRLRAFNASKTVCFVDGICSAKKEGEKTIYLFIDSRKWEISSVNNVDQFPFSILPGQTSEVVIIYSLIPEKKLDHRALLTKLQTFFSPLKKGSRIKWQNEYKERRVPKRTK